MEGPRCCGKGGVAAHGREGIGGGCFACGDSIGNVLIASMFFENEEKRRVVKKGFTHFKITGIISVLSLSLEKFLRQWYGKLFSPFEERWSMKL